MFQPIMLIAILTMNGFAQEPTSATNGTPKPTETTPASTPPTNNGTTTPNSGTTPPANNGATPPSGDSQTKTPDAGATPPAENTASSTPKEEAKAPPPVKALPKPTESHSDAGSHFTVEEMWAQSSGPVRAVLLTLLFMLVWAMGVGLERYFTLSNARRQSRKLVPIVTKSISSGDTAKALKDAQAKEFEKSYFAHLLIAGLVEFNAREDKYGIEAVERALDKNSIQENASLRKGLNILATVGSTAPFVGLVGTIFGIINAFSQIGAEGGADLTTLAPAIGEALITTAFGIIVAIVGVWLFNYFTAMIEGVNNDMASSAQELLDWCHKKIIPDVNAAK